MAPSSTHIAPRTSHPRPDLPLEAYNQKLRELATGTGLPPVKFQIILREGQEIVVGRIKVPTPGGHAFILRRFDTGAISLSTMFRASFPAANDASEKEETAWVKANYDTAGSNGGGKLRLAGTWVPTRVALILAEQYGLSHLLPALADAVPESRSAYRKNNTPSKGSNAQSAAAVANGVTNGAASAASGIPTSLPPVVSTAPQGSPAKREQPTSPVRQPPVKKSRKSASPAPASLKPSPSQPIRHSPRRPLPAKVQEEEEPEVPSVDPEQDIQEAKEEAARIRAEHLAAQAHQEVAAAHQTPSKNRKRNIEATASPPFTFDLDKIQEVAENVASDAMDLVQARPIINRRRLANLPPTQKAAAWGGLVFFIGLGASALFPNLLPGGGLW